MSEVEQVVEVVNEIVEVIETVAGAVDVIETVFDVVENIKDVVEVLVPSKQVEKKVEDKAEEFEHLLDNLNRNDYLDLLNFFPYA